MHTVSMFSALHPACCPAGQPCAALRSCSFCRPLRLRCRSSRIVSLIPSTPQCLRPPRSQAPHAPSQHCIHITKTWRRVLGPGICHAGEEAVQHSAAPEELLREEGDQPLSLSLRDRAAKPAAAPAEARPAPGNFAADDDRGVSLTTLSRALRYHRVAPVQKPQPSRGTKLQVRAAACKSCSASHWDRGLCRLVSFL